MPHKPNMQLSRLMMFIKGLHVFKHLKEDVVGSAPVFSGILLREATSRFFSYRFAWFWVVFESMFHIGYLALIFGAIRVRHIDGISSILWVTIGVFAFLSVRNTWSRSMNAIDASRALLIYNQVKPIKLVLVRAINELLVSGLVLITIVVSLYFFREEVVPERPMEFLYGLILLWFLGLGFGLVISFAQEFIQEVKNFVRLLMMPLYILSGVIFPVSAVPMPYREWLMYNPIAHGLEWMRASFSMQYHPVPGMSIDYFIAWSLSSVFVGFFIHHYGYKYFGVTR